ncbi:MAG: aminotransferase class III-fold pyridoxal phosphate-dependent enzyme, partial [Myxococcales bacterium]|nr:aminotransferase class III-fold pyridoxal phosphate-dependent enzyme [Myxococcales bacterium]
IRDGGVGFVAIEVTASTDSESDSQSERDSDVASDGASDGADAAPDAPPEVVLGYGFGGPLINYRDVPGPDRDPALKRRPAEVFYSADITVVERARGCGLGRDLKRAQIEWARAHGFRTVSGRNRVGDSMVALNRSFGAYPVVHLEGLHRDPEGRPSDAEYYHIPLDVPYELQPPEVEDEPASASVTAGRMTLDEEVDLASGLQQPFGDAPAFMASRELIGPLTSRLNLSNYTTPDVVQYAEHLRLMLPRGTRHMYFTSSRDETVDKGLRCLRLARPAAQVAIGLEGGYVGHITGAARSISDPRGFGPDLALYSWPRLPHPATRNGGAATAAALDAIVAERGADAIFGVVAEVVGERSGLRLEGDAATLLAAACRRHDIPLILVETATGGYRNGLAPWAVETLPPGVVPDMVLWYPGGQLGHVFVGDRYWQEQPLTLISTWDGDELSLIRAHEHLRAAGKLPGLAEASETLGALLEMLVPAHFADTVVGGLGLYRTLTFERPEDADAVQAACRKRGILLGAGVPGTLVVAPALSLDGPTIQSLRRRLNAALAAAAGHERAT